LTLWGRGQKGSSDPKGDRLIKCEEEINMPRKARECLDTSFYHLIVQGIKKEYIFNSKVNMDKYVQLLISEKEKFRVEVLAYCVMNNHAHILLYTEKITEMSKYMHSVNQKFAQFYNYINNERVGYVFRDRFKSEPIYNEKYLIRCIRYIHNNPVKAKIVKSPGEYRYSTYNNYLTGDISKIIKENIDINSVISISDIEIMKDNVFIDVEDNAREVIQTKLLEIKLKYDVSLTKLLKNECLIIEVVEEIKKDYKISYRAIIEELGISESTWKRIKKKNKINN